MPRPPESRRAASPERATRQEPPGVLSGRLLGRENERSLSAPGARDSAGGHSIDPCELGARPTAREPGTSAHHPGLLRAGSAGQIRASCLQGRLLPGNNHNKNCPNRSCACPCLSSTGLFLGARKPGPQTPRDVSGRRWPGRGRVVWLLGFLS